MLSLRNAPRRLAGRTRRALFPRPEIAALRRLQAAAARIPRRTPGQIEVMGWTLSYPDLLTLCPQWKSIFVEHSLRFTATSPHPRILDCGANVGLASLYFQRLYPHAVITAFEADPGICGLLRANLEANGAGKVEVVPAAVWTHDGTVQFLHEGADSGAVAAVAPEGLGEAATGPAAAIADVPAVRLRRWLTEGPEIDLLKLDVEGAELALLEDCEAELARVRALVVDLHEFDPAERRGPRLLQLLDRAGFHYALSELVPLGPAAGGPFPDASARWVSLVHAWRPTELDATENDGTESNG